MWNEFLPISMPIAPIAVCAIAGMACPLSWRPRASLSRAGQEHGLACSIGRSPGIEEYEQLSCSELTGLCVEFGALLW